MPAGHILSTTAIAPTLWTDSFPPYAAVEPVLSDPQKPNDPVGFQEVFASDTEVGMHMQSLHIWLTPASNLQDISACCIASSSLAFFKPGEWQSLAWRFVSLQNWWLQATNSASLLRRPHARQNTREFVRGSTVSMPFTPGMHLCNDMCCFGSKLC